MLIKRTQDVRCDEDVRPERTLMLVHSVCCCCVSLKTSGAPNKFVNRSICACFAFSLSLVKLPGEKGMCPQVLIFYFMSVYGGVYLDGRCDSFARLALALRRIMDVSECENSCSNPATTLNRERVSLRIPKTLHQRNLKICVGGYAQLDISFRKKEREELFIFTNFD
jgi:hypothetical protein